MIRRRKIRLYKGEFFDILKTVIKKQVGNGEFIREFESRFAEYIGTKFAIATCTGRNGLELLLEALSLNQGDEIIFPAYTLKDLISLVKKKGYTPVLVDIDEGTFNINYKLIERAISEKTKVIIATHIFGSPCNISKILDIARRYNLEVIEDCAHAAGSEYNKQKLGSFGRAAFFSFETTKPINTFGGGMVTTSDIKIASYVRDKIKEYPFSKSKIIYKIAYNCFEHFILHSPVYILISFLFRSEYFTHLISNLYRFIHKKSKINRFRYSNLQALFGLKQLADLDKRNRIRQSQKNELANLLSQKIQIQKILEGSLSTNYFFVVRLPFYSRQARKILLKRGVDISIEDEIADDCSDITGSFCPIAKDVFSSLIQIPLYDDININQIKYVARVLNESIVNKPN